MKRDVIEEAGEIASKKWNEAKPITNQESRDWRLETTGNDADASSATRSAGGTSAEIQDERAWWQQRARQERNAWIKGVLIRMATISVLWAAIARQYYQGAITWREADVMMVLVFAGVIGVNIWLNKTANRKG